MTGVINDSVRRLIGVFIGWLGLVLEAFHRIQIVTWSYNQKRLRLRYKIAPDTPIRNYDADLEQHIRAVADRYRAAGSDTRYAQTSGSTAAPKRILYTKSRLRSVRWMFTDMFARSFRAYHVARKSLYVFSSFENDQSLTSMLREERRLPSYLVTLQAPYRIERNPAIQELAAHYGEVAVRLWILVLSNPGVLYCTNPSTLWLFLRDVAENWQQSTRLIRDFQSGPILFGAAVLHVARRLESIGSAERLRRIASTDEPLPFAASVPGVQAYMCWTGGYVKPFLDRIEKFLSPDRYRRIPLTSMSTETIEAIGHYDCNSTTFLPMAKSVFYEFIEEGAQDRPENLKTATELRPMTAYTLVVSDSFGLRRYQTEDVFLCKGYSGKLPDLRFLRRRNLEYSFTGEKLSAEHLNQAFARLRNEFAELTPDVFLTCVPSLTQGDLLPHYKLVLVGAFDESSNVAVQIGEALAARCDTLLQEVNSEYRCKRHSGRLEMMRFEHLSFDDFITCFGAETQFKFLPLYRRTWEELLRQPACVLCV